MKKKNGRCLIFGAGDFDAQRLMDKGYPEYLLPRPRAGDGVYAVDGGLAACEELGISPDILIGDFDSLAGKELKVLRRMEEQDPGRVIKLAPEKDDTDMLAALRTGLQEGYESFLIYGGMGGRLDHTVANLQCLLFLKRQGASGCLIDERSIVFVLQGGERFCFSERLRGILSLFTLGKDAFGVDIFGLKYPLSGYTMRDDYPIGVSNEFIGTQGSVSLEAGELLCILSLECAAAAAAKGGVEHETEL